jgi:hypothetical protein
MFVSGPVLILGCFFLYLTAGVMDIVFIYNHRYFYYLFIKYYNIRIVLEDISFLKIELLVDGITDQYHAPSLNIAQS